jgi:hypothetical protein
LLRQRDRRGIAECRLGYDPASKSGVNVAQDGFGNNRTQPTGSSEPHDDDDDGMQKKSENVAHSQDGIKRKNLKNSRHLLNSPPTGRDSVAATGTKQSSTSSMLH